jgi:hypothetical protein
MYQTHVVMFTQSLLNEPATLHFRYPINTTSTAHVANKKELAY